MHLGRKLADWIADRPRVYARMPYLVRVWVLFHMTPRCR